METMHYTKKQKNDIKEVCVKHMSLRNAKEQKYCSLILFEQFLTQKETFVC